MAVIPYTPTPYIYGSPVSQLREEINRLFGTMDKGDTSGATASWIPAVDIYEYDNRFELLVDLPGVDPKDVEMTLDRGVLTLTGERKTERAVEQNEKDVAVRIERGHGRFHRRFILPESVDTERIEARSRNGVLEIKIEKQAKAQPKRIQVAA